MLSGEVTNTNFIVFGLTRSGLEPTIYPLRGEPANHYTSDVVRILSVSLFCGKWEFDRVSKVWALLYFCFHCLGLKHSFLINTLVCVLEVFNCAIHVFIVDVFIVYYLHCHFMSFVCQLVSVQYIWMVMFWVINFNYWFIMSTKHESIFFYLIKIITT